MSKHKFLKVSASLSTCAAAGVGLKLFQRNSNSKTVGNEDGKSPTRRKILLDGYELKQVQFIVRHGARTPIHTMKNVKEVGYNSPTFIGDLAHTTFNYEEIGLDGGPKPFSGYDHHYQNREKLLKDGAIRGSLTKLGQDQMYVIGQLLRKQYIHEAELLGIEFDPSEIHIRSTNTRRTIGTARCVVAGMFGAAQLNKLNSPVKIHVQSERDDALLPRPGACHVLRQINHYSMIHGGDLPDLRDSRLLLEDLLGVEPDGTPGKHKLNFIDVRDDIVARETHGYSYPKMLHPHRPMIEENASKIMYYSFCAHQESERDVAMKLSTGPLIKLIMDNIEQSEKKRTKMYIYSCHDSSLVGLLGTLDVFDFKWPPFGSHVAVELYENEDKQKYIRVSYNGEDQIIRGCDSELVPWEVFQENIGKYAIDKHEFEKVCSSNILEEIAQDVLEQEEGEVEDSEDKERSETPAGM